jgi:hypothetical protein
MIKNKLGYEMDGLLNNLDNYDITEEEILEMKEKMKEMYRKLKEKNKPKTITISAQTHSSIKKYCNSMDLNIGDWVTKVLINEINEERCTEEFEQEDYVKTETKEILERYEASKKYKSLYKTDKLIFHKKFAFKGYSSLDGKPVYECDFKNVLTLLYEYDVDCVVANKREIGNGIYHNLDLEVELLIPEKQTEGLTFEEMKARIKETDEIYGKKGWVTP